MLGRCFVWLPPYNKVANFAIIIWMRFIDILILLAVIVGSGFYIHTQVEAVCKVPLSYRIGQLDEQFDLTFDEARVAISEAESAWEQATGENLFTYDPNGDLSINFIFDDRQQFALDEINYRERLNEAENVNEEIKDTYESLVAQYDEREARYQTNVANYERRLDAYNERVHEYNEAGGAPPEAFEELEREKDALDDDLAVIRRQGDELNGIVDEINQLSEQGNELVEEYNEEVGSYNERFGESREFTQGDYQESTINIYKFIDETELELVLAHELGHALSLGHVENAESILHHLMGEQPANMSLTDEDLAEFERVCGRTTRSWIERLYILFGI